MTKTNTIRAIFRHQIWHILTFVVLALVARWYLNTHESASTGWLWRFRTRTWFWLAAWTPFVHQIYVWLAWRIELYTRAFSSRWGEYYAFRIYQVPFMVLLVARLVMVSLLALSNSGALDWSPALRYSLVAIVLPFVMWTLYSVMRYFGLDRACGIDHFVAGYNEAFERRGIYRYLNNAMYHFGLAVLYLPGLLLASPAALVVALMNHVLIWAHYFCTELPDMREIYG